MTIYRAIFRYNNADTCEWERWYYKCSVWYTNRENAEKHLDELNSFRDWLRDEWFKKYGDMFRCETPCIESIEVSDDFVPFEISHSEDNVYNSGICKNKI